MSDLLTNEAANYQAEVRAKLEDLKASLGNRWCRWGDWERKFIKNLTAQLSNGIIDISPKQFEKICLLWEKSLK